MRAEAAKAVLRHARAVALGGLLAVALAPAVASAGWAADPTPAPGPSQPTPSISPPSQQQIDDAKNALERLRNHHSSRGATTPGSTPTETISQVAGPVAGRRALTPRLSDQAWWTIASGALLLVVASEASRLRVRRAKHRKRT